VRAEPLRQGEPVDLAADATLRAVAIRHACAPSSPALPARREDLRRKVRVRLRKSLVVLLVDASDSMGTHARMSAAKGAAIALLKLAYQRRDRVAVVAFEGERAQVLLEPTGSTSLARKRLEKLPVGGATPLADGLRVAQQLIAAERLRDPQLRPTLVLLSDGGANVPLRPGGNVRAEACALASALTADGVRSLVFDASGDGLPRIELLELAQCLGTRCRKVGRLGAAEIVEAVR
jgi:magnesium chelatase subunit D